MAVPSTVEFKAAFPEFNGAPDTLVQAKILDAAARTSAVAWGDKHTMGVMYRTADLLAKSPMGRKMRMMLKDGTTAYTEDLKTMVRTVALVRGIRTT